MTEEANVYVAPEVCDNKRLFNFFAAEWWGNCSTVRNRSQRSRLTWNGWCSIVCRLCFDVLHGAFTNKSCAYVNAERSAQKKKRTHEEERRWWCQSFGDGAFRPGYKLGAQNALPASQHQSVRLFCCFQVNRLCLSLYGDSSRDFNTSWECVVQWKFQLEIIYFYYYYFFSRKGKFEFI